MGLTVRELVALLRGLPEEAGSWPVDTEGCDCVDAAADVDYDPVSQRVVITRRLVDRRPPQPKQPEPPNTGPPSKRWGV